MKTFKYILVSAAAVAMFTPMGWAEEGRGEYGSDQGQYQRGSDMQQPGGMQHQQQGGMQHQRGQGDQGMRGRFGQDDPYSMSRDTIKDIQRKLNERQQANLPVDGKWGQKTEDALRRFQEQEKINASGKPDQDTLSRLGVEKRES